jgi:hypothetical protein
MSCIHGYEVHIPLWSLGTGTCNTARTLIPLPKALNIRAIAQARALASVDVAAQTQQGITVMNLISGVLEMSTAPRGCMIATDQYIKYKSAIDIKLPAFILCVSVTRDP